MSLGVCKGWARRTKRGLLDDLLEPDPDRRLDRPEHAGPVLARSAVHHDRSGNDVLGDGFDLARTSWSAPRSAMSS